MKITLHTCCDRTVTWDGAPEAVWPPPCRWDVQPLTSLREKPPWRAIERQWTAQGIVGFGLCRSYAVESSELARWLRDQRAVLVERCPEETDGIAWIDSALVSILDGTNTHS